MDHVILDGIVHPFKWGSYDVRTLLVIQHVSLTDIVPQLDYEALVDTEKVFTTFTNACAQAGAVRCFPAGLIQGNATGSDVHLLFASTIDVSLAFCTHVSCARLTLGQQLALRLQRVGYTGLPAQSGELKCTWVSSLVPFGGS